MSMSLAPEYKYYNRNCAVALSELGFVINFKSRGYMKKLTSILTVVLSVLSSSLTHANTNKSKSQLVPLLKNALSQMPVKSRENIAELLKFNPELLSDEEKNELIRELLTISIGGIHTEGNLEIQSEGYLNELGASSFKDI